MDKACWMCSPGVSSHLHHRVNRGQGEGMKVDRTGGGRLRLLERGKKMHIMMTLKSTRNRHVTKRMLNCEESLMMSSKAKWEIKILRPHNVAARGGERARGR